MTKELLDLLVTRAQLVLLAQSVLKDLLDLLVHWVTRAQLVLLAH